MVSRTNALLAARDPEAPGVTSVRVALFEVASAIVPDREPVAL